MTLVLIVDDAKVFREPVAMALSKRGYRTRTACDGEEGIEALRQEPADLVLLDIRMPGTDGFHFLEAVRADPKLAGASVIAVTGSADKSDVVRAFQLGVRDYLLKSEFSLPALLDRIDKAIGGPPPKDDTAPPAAPAPAAPTPKPAPAATPKPTDLQSLKPLLTRSEIETRLDRAGELKAFSPTVTRILKLTQSKHCSVEQIARAIRQDQAIALKILRMANSAVYTRGEPVDSLDTALIRIGLAQIRQVMLNISVVDTFDESKVTAGFDTGRFWEHAIACGVVAAEIAHARAAEHADASFTAGLLHDVGRLIMIEQFPEESAHAVRIADELAVPLEEVEQRLLLFDHAQAMDRLLHRWSFPRDLIDPIVLHHHDADGIRHASSKRFTESATIALANRLCHALALGGSGNETLYPTEGLCAALELDKGFFDRISEEARRQTDDLKLAFLAESPCAGWADTLESYRKMLSEPVRPLMITEAPHYDAFDLFLNQLAEHAAGAKPNVAVMHVTSTRLRRPLSQMLLEAEAERGVERLPLIILSGGGGPEADDVVMRSRHVETVATPTRVATLIAALERCVAQGSSAAAA